MLLVTIGAWSWLVLALPVCAVHGYRSWQRDIRLRAADSPVWLSLDSHGWRLGMRDGRVISVKLRRFVSHPWIVNLTLRDAVTGKRYEVAVFPDSTSGDQHRRLRAWLG